MICNLGYAKVITWIAEIWNELDRGLIIDSFDKCGITTEDPTLFHQQLRHFVTNDELVQEYIDDDDGMRDLNAFDEYDSETSMCTDQEENESDSETDDDEE